MDAIQKLVQNLVMPILLMLTTAIGLYNTVQTNRLEEKSKELKLELESISIIEKQKEIDRKDIEFVRELKFKLYTEVKEAVKDNNTNLQKVTYEFVSNMIKDDEEFRNALLEVLQNSSKVDNEIKEQITENFKNEQVFKIQEAELKNVKSLSDNVKKTRVDIFYMEETEGVSKPIALDLGKALENNFEVKVRVLPKLTNAKNGYQIYQNEIRFEEKESSQVDEILSKIKTSIQEVPEKRLISYNTPNYISIFIKNR